MADSSDNPSADSFSLKLSMPGVMFCFSLFWLVGPIKRFGILGSNKGLLTFAEAEGTTTVFVTPGLLLSALLGPIESFLRPDLLDKIR